MYKKYKKPKRNNNKNDCRNCIYFKIELYLLDRTRICRKHYLLSKLYSDKQCKDYIKTP